MIFVKNSIVKTNVKLGVPWCSGTISSLDGHSQSLGCPTWNSSMALYTGSHSPHHTLPGEKPQFPYNTPSLSFKNWRFIDRAERFNTSWVSGNLCERLDTIDYRGKLAPSHRLYSKHSWVGDMNCFLDCIVLDFKINRRNWIIQCYNHVHVWMHLTAYNFYNY